MREERRQLTRREPVGIISRRTVVRRIPPASPEKASSPGPKVPGRPGPGSTHSRLDRCLAKKGRGVA